ncbi:MAG: biotin--[acetyl-CoA-carboxylase] ligase [Gammaproteobacteria bacterium]|nr:biotin--[acetyl-CoA-carboxylase] ligase [Gammaproteobacteria bacterium]
MMSAEPIDESRIRQAVEARGLAWCYRTETESTNADVLQHHARHGREVVAVCETQSAGRGRRGRQWLSPFARNIYCTVGISRNLPPARQGLLSIVAGLALCRSLRAQTGLAVSLKWPNDLLLGGGKLGGILIESRAHPGGGDFFAIGFGLNVFMSADELAEIEAPATSLAQHLEAGLDRSEILLATFAAVVDAIRAFELDGIEQLIDDFSRFDAFHEAVVEVVSAERRIAGVNRGISADGQLRLETEQGIELHSSAEISLRAVIT